MHSAPTVDYPLGRSRFQAGLWLSCILVSYVAGVLWWMQSDNLGWRQGLMGLAWLIAALLGGREWQKTARGDLHWDGTCWSFTSGSKSVTGVLSVHLDLQFLLLLSLCPLNGSRIWLWPERASAPARWTALRRAAFSRPGAQSVDVVQA